MRRFEPSAHSYGAFSALSLIGPAIGAAGGIAATGIEVVGARKAQEAQQKAERRAMKQQRKAMKQEMKQAELALEAARARDSASSGGAGKTLLVMGGVVLTVGMIVGAVVLGKQREDEVDDEFEDET